MGVCLDRKEKIMELVKKRDASLFVDVVCKCGRWVALSNAYQHEGLYLCPRCSRDIITAIDKLFKER